AGADVWLIPVGGTYTIDANEAWEYIRRLSPKLVIPMHYRPNDGALDITGIEVFLQYAEKDKVISRPNGEYTLNKAELQEVTGKILYMERRK
ncbi:MAG: MBL fold metallo-hydrolase, partial [Clostridia bacterium]|nr:MBL fold metallo-hydrolase [Clostridia bacterium]